MENLFSSMSLFLLNDMLSHKYDWDSPKNIQVHKKLPVTPGNMIGAISGNYEHSLTGEIQEVLKV
jgi:hypothetical protein